MSDFRCKYCSRTFSRRGAFRNHLKIHRDQMYLEENELTRENVSNSEINSVTIKNTLQKTITLADEIIYDEISLDINDTNIMNVDFYEVKFKLN
jgi:Zinc finger, C2H2 type